MHQSIQQIFIVLFLSCDFINCNYAKSFRKPKFEKDSILKNISVLQQFLFLNHIGNLTPQHVYDVQSIISSESVFEPGDIERDSGSEAKSFVRVKRKGSDTSQFMRIFLHQNLKVS